MVPGPRGGGVKSSSQSKAALRGQERKCTGAHAHCSLPRFCKKAWGTLRGPVPLIVPVWRATYKRLQHSYCLLILWFRCQGIFVFLPKERRWLKQLIGRGGDWVWREWHETALERLPVVYPGSHCPYHELDPNLCWLSGSILKSILDHTAPTTI